MQRSSRISFEGREILSLSPEDSLLALSLHAGKTSLDEVDLACGHCRDSAVSDDRLFSGFFARSFTGSRPHSQYQSLVGEEHPGRGTS